MTWLVTAGIVVGWILFGLVIVAGVLLNFVGLFGNWLILGAVAIAAALSGFEYFGPYTLGALLVLAILGEVIEAAASGVGAAKFGGGKGSMVASVVGCIVGAIVGTPIFPIIGTIIGACAGAFLGAAGWEYMRQQKDLEGAMKVGFGAALGKVAGLFAKSFVGFAMLGIAAWNF